MKQENSFLSLLNPEIVSCLKKERAIFLEGADFRFLPLLLPLLGRPALVFYSGVPEKIYDGLSLFLREGSVFFQKNI